MFSMNTEPPIKPVNSYPKKAAIGKITEDVAVEQY